MLTLFYLLILSIHILDGVCAFCMAPLIWFLDAWCSIKQVRFEEAMIFLLVASALVLNYPLTWLRFGSVIITGTLARAGWILSHHSPKQHRTLRLYCTFQSIIRLLSATESIFYLVILLQHFNSAHLVRFVHCASVTGLLYSLALDLEGTGTGKRRKMALDRAKEMFGTSWVVEPEAVPA